MSMDGWDGWMGQGEEGKRGRKERPTEAARYDKVRINWKRQERGRGKRISTRSCAGPFGFSVRYMTGTRQGA